MEQKLIIQRNITYLTQGGGFAIILVVIFAYIFAKIDIAVLMGIISPVLLMMQKANGFWTDSSIGSQSKDAAIANSTPIVPNVPASDKGQA